MGDVTYQWTNSYSQISTRPWTPPAYNWDRRLFEYGSYLRKYNKSLLVGLHWSLYPELRVIIHIMTEWWNFLLGNKSAIDTYSNIDQYNRNDKNRL